jgi:hypothetical protein
MSEALLTAVVVAAVAFMVLTVVEVIIHRLFHWKSKNYRYGVILFALLAGVYAYVTTLGS